MSVCGVLVCVLLVGIWLVSLGFVLSVSVCFLFRGSLSSLFVGCCCCCRGPWFGPVWRSLVPLGSVRCGVPGVVVCCCCLLFVVVVRWFLVVVAWGSHVLVVLVRGG